MIKRVGVVIKPSGNFKKEYLRMEEAFSKHRIPLILEAKSAANIGLNPKGARQKSGGELESIDNFASIASSVDLMISLGGDGTLISLMRRLFTQYSSFSQPLESSAHHSSLALSPPLTLGINIGRLGFLTAFKLDALESFIPKLLSGDISTAKHMVLVARLRSSKREFFSINEFLIAKKMKKKGTTGMIDIEVRANQRKLNNYLCDGLIIATPTGSSAYNISAGGAVVYPYSRNILLTPVCPHSLTQRPLILSDQFSLEIKAKNANLIIDGQHIEDINDEEAVEIYAHPLSAELIYPKDRDYFLVLREKFHWGI